MNIKYNNKDKRHSNCQYLYNICFNSIYFYHIFSKEGFHTIKIIFNNKLSSCSSIFSECNQIYEVDLIYIK